jgi:hypothetical protein
MGGGMEGGMGGMDGGGPPSYGAPNRYDFEALAAHDGERDGEAEEAEEVDRGDGGVGDSAGGKEDGEGRSDNDTTPNNIRVSVDYKESKQLLVRQFGSLNKETAAKFWANKCFRAAFAVRLQVFMTTGKAEEVVVPLSGHQDGPPAGYVCAWRKCD